MFNHVQTVYTVIFMLRYINIYIYIYTIKQDYKARYSIHRKNSIVKTIKTSCLKNIQSVFKLCRKNIEIFQ